MLSSLIKVCTVIPNNLISVYTISQQSDQGQDPLSFSGTVWSGSTLFDILRSLIRFYTVCHSQQSDQGLHCFPFSAFWLGSTLLAILSSLIKDYTVCILSRLIRVYTNCHSQQSNQGVHYLPFTVWSGSIHVLQFSVLSGSTLFAILSLLWVYTVCLDGSLIRVYTTCHSQQYDQGQGLHCYFQEQSDQGLHFAILSCLIRAYTICNPQHSDQDLHYLSFIIWSGSTLFAILSIIRVYNICHSQLSEQGLHCHSKKSHRLHYFSAVWARSRSSVILRNSLI